MPYRRLRYYYAGIGLGSGSALTPPRSISCDEAIALIDAQFPPEGELSAALDAHVLGCHSCCCAYQLEGSLREYIAPAEMPTPSTRFEAMLMAQLKIGAQEHPVYEEEPATDFLSRWGWAVGLVTMAGLVSVKMGSLVTAIKWLRVPALTAYAWAASYMRGDVAIAVGKLSPAYLQHHMPIVGVMMAVTVCVVGAFAVSKALKH